MPSGSRSKEDTWKADDLGTALRGKKDDRRRSDDRKRSDKDVRERRKTDKDEDRDRKERKHRENADADRKDRVRDKDRDRDREKDRDRRDREKGGKEKDRSERHRSKQDPENGERRRDDRKKTNDEKSGSREQVNASRSSEDRRHRRHRDDGERRSEDKERHRRTRDEDEGREKKHRSHREREEEGGKSRRHRDDDVEKKHSKDEQGEDRKHRSHRDRDPDRNKQRPSNKDSTTHTKSQPDVTKEKKKADKIPTETKRRTLKKKKKKEELNEGNDEYNYDEEEFEDYDDDFEDDDEENASDRDEGNCNEASNDTQTKTSAPKNDMDELLSALDKENERLLHSAKNKRSTDPSGVKEQPIHREIDQGADNRRTFINFSSAKKSHMSSVAASKARCRGNDLLKMIELDVAHYELFDMPPVNEYELYMRTFGCSNTRQAYVQTHDDNLECETQTEVTECTDKWSQHPPEDFNCTGGDEDPKESDELERKPIDAVKLGKFIHNASQVITMLLEEEYSEISTRNGPIKNQSNFVLSESFIQLETSDITKDRHVAFSYFSPLQTKYLLTAYSRPHTIHPEDRLSSSGLIFVWNVGEPSQPEKVLVCESQPQCCCFSPGQATLVFAGMHDGSLTVWDLSESSSLHRPHTIGGQDWLLRYPTYNTAGVLHHENHHSSVVQVTPIVAAGDSTQASLNGVIGTGGGGGGSEGMSFQLASLEEQAIIHLWVVAEIMHPDPAGSESDLGLLPGGRVKLVKSSSIKLENPTRTPTLQSAMQALDLCLLPQNNSHFYVATDTGSIIHGVRYGGKAPPKAYRPQTEGLMRVTSLDFSPFCEPTFLAGCADGSLSLYMTESEYPLMTWPEATENATPIVWVRWCRSRPSVFFVLDSNAFLYIWDLLMDDLIPLKQEKVADARVTSFALSNDYTATGCGTPGRKPQMVMSLENGATEVHSISREFSAMMPDEVNQFSQYLQKVV